MYNRCTTRQPIDMKLKRIGKVVSKRAENCKENIWSSKREWRMDYTNHRIERDVWIRTMEIKLARTGKVGSNVEGYFWWSKRSRRANVELKYLWWRPIIIRSTKLQRLRWMGYVNKLQEESTIWLVLYMVEWKTGQNRGRPRTRATRSRTRHEKLETNIKEQERTTQIFQWSNRYVILIVLFFTR